MKRFIATILAAAAISAGNAQDRLYPDEFPLGDVTLLDGPLKTARDLNIKTLLQYDCDRLLAPYRKEAGLAPKAKPYPNWDGLDGHVGGHYLTAMALNAATGNDECRRRMEYFIAELKECAAANAKNHPSWGRGYVGGMPNSEKIWSNFKKGDFGTYFGSWAPFYNIHKMYAGLRDAWLYCGNEDAKQLFLGFADWAIDLTANLSDQQMEQMLNNEHGGMNEVIADAYAITGDKRYLDCAKRFSHRRLLTPMMQRYDCLDNMHANTQVPKVVGFERIAELSGDDNYHTASAFFWDIVTGERSLAFVATVAANTSRAVRRAPISSTTSTAPKVATPTICSNSPKTSTAAIPRHATQTSTNSQRSTTYSPPNTPDTVATCISRPHVRAITATIPPQTRLCGAALARVWKTTASIINSFIHT